MNYIGSARIDEHNKITGGQPGDQKQTNTPDLKGEVSQQKFYVHSKGWVILRPKSKVHAKGIAEAMIRACNNINIGYNQNERGQILRNGTRATTPTNCDCSSLVRQCIKEATGKDPGAFNTSTEKAALLASGLFDSYFYYEGTTLCEGDVLVTKTKGHTAVVTQAEAVIESAPRPTIRYGSKGSDVRYLHHQLRKLKYGVNEASDFFDSTTKLCVMNFQASRPGLEVDGICGPRTWKEIDKI